MGLDASMVAAAAPAVLTKPSRLRLRISAVPSRLLPCRCQQRRRKMRRWQDHARHQEPLMSTQPVISIHGLDMKPRPETHQPSGATAQRFHVERGALTERLGLTTLGINVTRVAPGKTAYPFHSHRCNDELFYILAGHGELRLGQIRHAVKPGDVIGCPKGGPETAHQLVNTGSEPLHYLSIDSNLDPEICEYPDSKKVGVWVDKFEYLTRSDSPVDYWDGE
jgi:uncharacterized cupin superfamily protein